MSINLIGKTSVDFIGLRKVSFTVSGIMILAGLYALVMMTLGRSNMGIEFSGGTMVQGYFDKPVNIGKLRDVVQNLGFADATIQELKRDIPNSFVFRTKASPERMEKGKQIEDALQAAFPDNAFHLDSIHEVGPAVGKSLQTQARLAVLISLAGILIYIAARFDFRFGVAATIAMMHDVLVSLAIVHFFQWEVTVLVISAVLTLAGYSLTDKVVVFDRIRENLKKTIRRQADFVPGVNLSINEVLSRTVITVFTTLLAALAIVIAGGEVLRDFAALLSIGFVIGTYSSIFVAAPIYVEWENRRPKRFK